METLCMWRWYLPDVEGRLKPSRWRMTEDTAQARYPGCARVEGSLEVRLFERYIGHTMDSGLVRRGDGAMMPPQQRDNPQRQDIASVGRLSLRPSAGVGGDQRMKNG